MASQNVNADPIDRTVRQFMKDNGIDENRVSWYRVTKEHDGAAVLELRMYMTDTSRTEIR